MPASLAARRANLRSNPAGVMIRRNRAAVSARLARGAGWHRVLDDRDHGVALLTTEKYSGAEGLSDPPLE